MVVGCKAIYSSLGGSKSILDDEQPTIDFAYSCVVTTKSLFAGDVLSSSNIWVKRPGTGEIKAKDYENLLGKSLVRDLPINSQLSWSDLAE